MARNFFRRVETAFPVEDARLKARVLNEGLVIPLSDNAQAWVLFPDGRWKRVRPGTQRRAAQEVLLEELGSRGGGEGPDMDELRRARAR
jgi:polyphosphate kinase